MRTRSVSILLLSLACSGSTETATPRADSTGAVDSQAADVTSTDDVPGALDDVAQSEPDVEEEDTAPTPVFDWKALPVTAPGPYGVGHRVHDVTYTLPGVEQPRTIRLHVWYPTTATEGEHPVYGVLFADPISLDDAPLEPVPWGRAWPVLVHSHGHQGFAGNSAFVMRQFASHGWIAVAPDHTGNTIDDNLDPRPPWMYYARSFDLVQALDAVETDAFGLEVGFARVDTEHAMLSGHSYGVFTGWASLGATFVSGDELTAGPCATCTAADKAIFAAGLHDPRLVGGILMAGSIDRKWFGVDGHTSVEVPILSMSGGEDKVGADAQFDSTAGVELTWMEIAGACHQSFGVGGCETLETEVAEKSVAAWTLGFARKVVLGDDSQEGLLSGAEPVASGIVVKHHGP